MIAPDCSNCHGAKVTVRDDVVFGVGKEVRCEPCNGTGVAPFIGICDECLEELYFSPRSGSAVVVE